MNFICDHPDIRAISFVGSDQAVSTDANNDKDRQDFFVMDCLYLLIINPRFQNYHFIVASFQSFILLMLLYRHCLKVNLYTVMYIKESS